MRIAAVKQEVLEGVESRQVGAASAHTGAVGDRRHAHCRAGVGYFQGIMGGHRCQGHGMRGSAHHGELWKPQTHGYGLSECYSLCLVI